MKTENYKLKTDNGLPPRVESARIHAKIFGMEVKVNVPDEIAAQAKARGMRVEDYVQEILTQQAAGRSPNGASPRTPEEIRAWLDSLAQFSDKIPPLPEAISRDWIYQDHN